MKRPKPTQKEYGRIGGLIGGKIRAERLSPEERAAIAKKAAEARWSKPVKDKAPNSNTGVE
jgi:hypothetical protein